MPILLLNFSAKSAGNCFLKENTHSRNGCIDISETLRAMAVILLLNGSVRCAGNFFLKENTQTHNGYIDIIETLRAMPVSTRHARIRNARLVKRASIPSAK